MFCVVRYRSLRRDDHSSRGVLPTVMLLLIYLFTAVGLLPGGSGYCTCKQDMKSVTTKFKSGGLREKHVVASLCVI